jgi:chemotaxis protein methyltransferase CheR
MALEILPQIADDGHSLLAPILEGVRESFLVLDDQTRIVMASGGFNRMFDIERADHSHARLFDLDHGAWDIPALHLLFDHARWDGNSIRRLRLTQNFPRINERTFVLQATKIPDSWIEPGYTLLSFEDLTEKDAATREMADRESKINGLLLQKDVLLREMQHRIVNSLQIVANILAMKIRSIASEEVRGHLRDANRRIMAVAVMQRCLSDYAHGEPVAIGAYLTKLCAQLTDAMIDGVAPVMIEVLADESVLSGADATNLGVIVTELVINALKYAFVDRNKDRFVTVRYQRNGDRWILSVSDNGGGSKPPHVTPRAAGVGTKTVRALAAQLKGEVSITSSPSGYSVTICADTGFPGIGVPRTSPPLYNELQSQRSPPEKPFARGGVRSPRTDSVFMP